MKDFYIIVIVLCFIIYFLVAIYKELYKEYKANLLLEKERLIKERQIQDEILGWKND